MDENQEYIVQELLDRLAEDPSWLSDPEQRIAVVAELKQGILQNC